ncbi:MAG: arginine ABC transporter permease ArtQ [Arsenophonus endosymbiont of Ceratovacuna japonica]
MINNLLFLINSTSLTLILAGSSLILGLLLSILFTIWESILWKPIALISSCLMALIRGLPELLVILFTYYGTLKFIMLLSDGIHINFIFWQKTLQIDSEWFFPKNNEFDFIPLFCGILSLSLLYAAYGVQILKGALKAIPIGQWESGYALDLNQNVIFLRLIMPQMLSHALPGLSNQWLVLLKDTALVSTISINDLMLQTKSIINRTNEPFTWYLIVAFIYLIITLISKLILYHIEILIIKFKFDVKK